MKPHFLFLILSWSLGTFALAQQEPATAPAASPAAMPQRSAAELEKLVAPIALYPDPLIATILPASVYPLEIVQAARFVKDTNNVAKLDAQPWDTNVKAVARVPEVIQKMNTELSWTTELGEAFLAQDKELFDAIQKLRGQAAQIGNLKTSPQQIVTVTNIVVEKTIEQQVVVVTNTVVQVQPANPEVVYVPQYSPTVVYTTPPPDPAGTLLTFGVGMLVGAAIADNNCDWHGGGCYHGSYHGDVNINNVNINNNNNINANRNVNSNRNVQRNSAGAGQKWQPDQSRLGKSGSPNAAASARSGQSRGWGAGGASPAAASAGGRSAAGSPGARSPSTQASIGGQSADRSPGPQASASARAPSPGASPNASRSGPAASASPSRPSPAASPSAASSSAFGGASGGGSDARNASSRGSSSRSAGGGGAARGGGGGRSGGGGGGRR